MNKIPTINHVLFCGLGSIGQRHLKIFRTLGVNRIDAYKSGNATLKIEPGNQPDYTFQSLEKALSQKPQAVIITNPTSHHLKTALASLQSNAHILIEKPISNTLNGLNELIKLAKKNNLVIAIGCNFRFHPFIQSLKKIIDDKILGKPLLSRAHFGAWLPGWHPWEDYKISYAARKELGGGAVLTHIHEIDYLIWLFGQAKKNVGLSLDFSVLDTTVDEISTGIIKHDSGILSTVSLSLCQKIQSRTLEVFFDDGIVTIDFIKEKMIYQKSGKKEQSIVLPDSFSFNDTYLSQNIAFMNAIADGNYGNLCTVDQAIEDLTVALSIHTNDI